LGSKVEVKFCIGLWYSLVIFRSAFVQEPTDVTDGH
jgi:hypothetical protein